MYNYKNNKLLDNRLVSYPPYNVVNNVVYYLHNQPGRIGYEEIHVTLAEDEREALGELTSKGKHKSQKILAALILLGCDEGGFQTKRSTNEEIARAEYKHEKN